MNYRTSENGYTRQADDCTSAASCCAVMLIMDAVLMASILLCVRPVSLVLVVLQAVVLLGIVILAIVIINSKLNIVKTDSKICKIA